MKYGKSLLNWDSNGKVEQHCTGSLSVSNRKLKFYWLDVFADRAFEGNQLAVFIDAGDLNSDQMQKIAKEMNISETTFITGYEKDDSGNVSFTTRIFTTEEELPFAGHPTLGTGFLLRTLHGSNSITLNLKVGPIKVEFQERGGRIYGEMKQNDPEFGQVHDPARIAEVFGVTVEDLEKDIPVQTVTTGNPFIIVPFKKLQVIEKLKPDFSKMDEYLTGSDARFFYTLSMETVKKDALAHARMIFYGGEDPATGSAAGPAAAWLLKYNLMEPEKPYYIEQGLEIGRPSRIFIRGSLEGGNPVHIRVGGYCELVSQGELDI